MSFMMIKDKSPEIYIGEFIIIIRDCVKLLGIKIGSRLYF